MASTLKHVDLFQPDHRVPVQQNVSGKLTIWLKCSNSEMVLGSLSLSYKKITFIPKLPKIRCFSIELTGMKWLNYNASVTIYDHRVLIGHWVWFVLLGWSHLKQQTSRKAYKIFPWWYSTNGCPTNFRKCETTLVPNNSFCQISKRLFDI